MENSSLQIRSSDELAAFLEGKPIEWAEAIASRAALRVLPLALGLLAASDLDTETLDKHCMLLFRANFIAWARSRYRDVSFEESSGSAAQAAFTQNLLNNELYDHCLSTAAYAVTPHDKISAAEMAGFNAGLAADFGAPLRAGKEYPYGGKEVWAAVEVDCQILLVRSIQGLRDEPLWPLEFRRHSEAGANLPSWAMVPLGKFLRSDFVQKGQWSVFLNWYMAILPNNNKSLVRTYFSKDAIIYIGQIKEETWRNPDFALQQIEGIHKLLDGEGERELLDEAIKALPQQRPAAFRFEWRDEKIAAAPPAANLSDGALAADLFNETRQKAQELRERLSRSNADPRVVGSVVKLLDVMPDEIADLRPGLLRSRSRSIEADAIAYRERENELSPDAIAQLIDLSESLRDLQACYPEIREIEAEALALDLAGKDIDAVKRCLDQIVASVDQATDIVDPSASEALRTMATIAEDPAASFVRERRIADYAVVVRNFISPLLRKAGKEILQLMHDTYVSERPNLVSIAGKVVKTGIIGVAITSCITLFGPLTGTLALVGGFGTPAQMITLIMDWKKRLDD
jgi:hypothetical protein